MQFEVIQSEGNVAGYLSCKVSVYNEDDKRYSRWLGIELVFHPYGDLVTDGFVLNKAQ